jgi:hypothetical protein
LNPVNGPKVLSILAVSIWCVPQLRTFLLAGIRKG